MLVDLNTVLGPARRQRYAVPAFDCTEDVLVRAILETAEARNAPVILMCLEEDLAGNGMAYLPGLIKGVADHHAIPVVLHLDHATNLDLVKQALDAGFSSVMVDGSQLPFTDNVRLTKGAVELAHARGVTVEGELGHVGGMDLSASECRESILTEADEVIRFIGETGVDALAVSIGTAHGVYQSLPNLDIDRLAELNAASSVPLVLHGGSGTPDDQIRAAVQNGLCKLNVYADLRIAMRRGLEQAGRDQGRPDPLPGDLFRPIKEQAAQVVNAMIDLLGAGNQG
jgi:ketose-bisphosphate aldolase